MNNSGRLSQGQKLFSNCIEDLNAESIDEHRRDNNNLMQKINSLKQENQQIKTALEASDKKNLAALEKIKSLTARNNNFEKEAADVTEAINTANIEIESLKETIKKLEKEAADKKSEGELKRKKSKQGKKCEHGRQRTK